MKAIRCPLGAASFPVPVYGGRVIICLTRAAHDELHQALDGSPYKMAKQVRGVTSIHTEKDQRAVYLIGVFEDGLQTLVHELAHVTFSILKHASVPITVSNDEAFAYLIDTLWGESVRAMREIRRKQRA